MNTKIMLERTLARAQLANLVAPLILGLLLAWQYYIQTVWRGMSSFYITGFFGFFWCLIITVFAARNRCSEMELSMPISGRSIWRTHVAAALALSAIHVAVFITPLSLTADAYTRGEFLSLSGHILAGLILTASLIHRIQPGKSLVSDSGQLNGAVGAGLIAMIILLVFHSPWLSLAAVAASGLILLLAGRRVSESLTLADDHAAPRGGYQSLGRWESAARNPAVPFSGQALSKQGQAGLFISTLWSLGTANLGQFHLFFKIFGFYMIFSTGSALVSGEGGIGVAISCVLAALICLRFLAPELIHSGSPYAHLPVPRRALYAGILLPAAVALGAGLVVQASWDLFSTPSPRLVQVRNQRDVQHSQYRVRVPPQYHRIAWDGKPPMVTGSTGETLDPTPRPLLLTMGSFFTNAPVLYNPYEVGKDSSAEFVVEQFTRAVRDVYDLELDPEQARFIVAESRRGDLSGVDGLRLARKQQRIASSFILFALIWALFSALFALFSRLVRPARWDRWRAALKNQRVNAGGIAFVAVLVFILSPVLSFTGGSFIASVLVIQLSHIMPGPLLSWAIALICAGGAYLLGQEFFARREVVPG